MGWNLKGLDAFSGRIILSTCYLLSTSLPDKIQQTLQTKHPSVVLDSQSLWVTALMKMTLTLHETARQHTQHTHIWLLDRPNEDFRGCLSNTMNHACPGQVRHDWINSIFRWIAWLFFLIYSVHLASKATGLCFRHNCLLHFLVHTEESFDRLSYLTVLVASLIMISLI